MARDKGARGNRNNYRPECRKSPATSARSDPASVCRPSSDSATSHHRCAVNIGQSREAAHSPDIPAAFPLNRLAARMYFIVVSKRAWRSCRWIA